VVNSNCHNKDASTLYFVDQLPPELLTIFNKLDITRYSMKDGREIAIYKLRNEIKDNLILMLPYGVSVSVLLKLIESLSNHFNVICWESVGCPDNTIHINDYDYHLISQSLLLKDIIDDQALDDFHMVSWCQASQIVIHSLMNYEILPKSISLISPAGMGCSNSTSEFDRSGLPLYLDIEKNGLAYAKQLLKLMQGYVKKDSINDDSISLSKIHLFDAECTLRFSSYMKSYVNNIDIVNDLLPEFFKQFSVLSIHSSDDNYTHVSETLELQKKYYNVSSKIYDTGGHLLIYKEPDLIAKEILKYSMK